MKMVVWLALLLHSIKGISSNEEVNALTAFRNKLTDPDNILQSWDPGLDTPCTCFHVTCDSAQNRVTRIDLGASNLAGELVPELGLLRSLQYMELYHNSITGTIPDELGRLTNLVSLDLYMNQLTGSIPSTLGAMKKLKFLRLSSNGLTGSIPLSLTEISTLEVLDLSSNDLSGKVPLSGSYTKFTPLSFTNNPRLCYPIGDVCA